MRVLASSTHTTVRDSAAARRAGAGGFSLSEGAYAATRNTAGHLQAISGVDVLVALQGLDDKGKRRRRAAKKGRAALDALDALKLGLVTGVLDRAALDRLKAAAAEVPSESGEPGLDQVLAEINLRVQVEIAKLSRG